ncbi:OmpA family protein [Acinetobacter sp. c2-A9]|uniref:OmpA family protein n=1 Tax=Acinetobacter sp. c2-A9 TaxID=3342802 RepID=UPI0035BB13BA
MNSNIIEHLTRTVSPVVLNNTTDQDGNRTSLLEKIYAIIIARLADRDVYSGFANTPVNPDDHSFFDRLLPELTHRSQMTQELAKHYSLTEQETQSLATRAAPLAYNELLKLAGSTALPTYLSSHLGDTVNFIPTWAYSFIPVSILGALGLGGVSAATHATTHATTPTATAQTVSAATPHHNTSTTTAQPEETGGFMKVLLPIAGFLVAGGLAMFLMKSCKNTQPTNTTNAPAAVSAVASSTVTSLMAPTLNFATDAQGNLLAGAMANVGDVGLKDKLMAAFTNVFGANAAQAFNVNVDPAYDVNLPFMDKLPEILALVKSVPSAMFKLDGNHIMVSAPNPDDANKLMAGIKVLAPNYDVMLDNMSAPNVAASDAVSSAPTATISSTEPSVMFENGRLNFYFATAKADVAPDALNKAEVILAAAKQGKKLGVSGYTDSTGNAATNKALSKKRAEAVKAFLVKNGVPATQIELVKPKETVGAVGKDQEGRRVEVYILDGSSVAVTAPASASQ